MEQKKLKVKKGLESAVVVDACDVFYSYLEEHLNILEEAASELGVTPKQYMDALEEVFTNNNSYHLMGLPDPCGE